jgi:hypothetical protein
MKLRDEATGLNNLPTGIEMNAGSANESPGYDG